MRGLLLLILLGGCQPLTLSHEGVIDFQTYNKVYVAPLDANLPSYAYGYLIDELREESGFAEVYTDPQERTAIRLDVYAEVHEDRGLLDDPDDYEWDATATFELSVGGRIIDQGEVSDTSGASPEEALEDVLDEIAHHYLAPYRI